MGDIKIKITEITTPNDFRVSYKVGSTPYPFDTGYVDYGYIFSGGTTTIDLIGDFIYSEEYWIMISEILYPERWMVKNIKINDNVIYAQFLVGSPTPTRTMNPTVTPSETPRQTISVTRSITPSITPSSSRPGTPSVTPSISRTPSITRTPSKTPSITPTPTISPSIPAMPVMITNMNGSRGISMVSVNGLDVLDLVYDVIAGQQKVGSTTQRGPSYNVVVELNGVSNNESINVNGVCVLSAYQNVITFNGIDTRSGITLYYSSNPC